MAGFIETLGNIVGVKHNEPLTSHTLQQLDSVAEMYVEVDKLDALLKIVSLARESKIPVYILGSGARLTADNQIKGLVIKNNCRRFDKVSMKGSIKQQQLDVDTVQVYAESGVLMNQLVRFTIEEGLEGLEYQLGLPGTVGGAVYTNAKYPPKYLYVNTALQSMRLMHEDGEIATYGDQLPYFVYTEDDLEESKDIILSVVFKLKPSDKKMLWARGEEAVAWRTQEAEKRRQNVVK